MIVEALVEFLMANLPFLLIVIAGIWSFFKRTNTEHQERKPQQRYETFESVEEKKEIHPTIPFEKKAEKREVYSSVPPKKVAQRTENIETQQIGTLSKQKLVEAVIWSEILGKPRSKNPHHTNMLTRLRK